MNIHRFAEVTSTQDVARRLAAEGAPHGTVVAAGAQTAGRGTQGRSWASAPGMNLYLTAVLRTHLGRPLLLAEAPLLTMGLAARLAEALDLQVKWPNDLVAERDGRRLKAGGILGEVDAEGGDGERVRSVLLGLGLNVDQTEFPDLPDATSLALLHGPQDREQVLARVAAILQGDLLTGWRERWRARAHTLGRRVSVQGREGLARDIAPDGALLLETAAGVCRIYAGDVL